MRHSYDSPFSQDPCSTSKKKLRIRQHRKSISSLGKIVVTTNQDIYRYKVIGEDRRPLEKLEMPMNFLLAPPPYNSLMDGLIYENEVKPA